MNFYEHYYFLIEVFLCNLTNIIFPELLHENFYPKTRSLQASEWQNCWVCHLKTVFFRNIQQFLFWWIFLFSLSFQLQFSPRPSNYALRFFASRLIQSKTGLFQNTICEFFAFCKIWGNEAPASFIDYQIPSNFEIDDFYMLKTTLSHLISFSHWLSDQNFLSSPVFVKTS